MSIYDKASLVLIPSGTKTSKVYSQKPVSGDGDFTFSRSTAATRVNADGNIEKETSNLLLQSNSFNTTWLNAATTETSGQAGYDGTNDAWRIDKSNSGGYIYQNISQSGVQTFSVYAKAGTSTWIQVVANGSSNALSFFDLDNGVLGATSANIISRDITSVGNGYYRCSISVNIGTIARVRFYVAEGDNDTNATSGNIYIQDAQLNQGLIAQEVITTTTAAVEGGITDNVPRLDYTDSSCPALLLEPQRTNVFTNSEYFGGTDWTKGNSSITTNATTSPSGLVDGSFLVPNTSTSTHTCRQSVGITSGTYTLSVYAKQGGYKNLLVWFDSHSGGVGVNLDDLSVFRDENNDGYTIEDFGNGWVRIAVTITASSTASPNFYVYSNAATPAITHAGDGTSGIYIYGAQVEAGSYATSYIPTYGTSVTRNGDVLTNAGTLEMFDNNAGTLYVEFSALANDGRDNSFRFLISDGTNNDRIQIGLLQNDLLYASVVVNNVGTSGVDYSLPNPASNHKIAVTYTQTKFDLWVDGVKVDTDTNTAIPSGMYRYDFLRYANNNDFVEGNIKQTMYFPTALTDQEAIDLTTL